MYCPLLLVGEQRLYKLRARVEIPSCFMDTAVHQFGFTVHFVVQQLARRPLSRRGQQIRTRKAFSFAPANYVALFFFFFVSGCIFGTSGQRP